MWSSRFLAIFLAVTMTIIIPDVKGREIPEDEANNELQKMAEKVRYIGSIAHKGQKGRGVGEDYDIRDYYVSTAAASYRKALDECKNFFGEDASLVNIETLDEWEALRDFLSVYGDDNFYWTGGSYNGEEFVWSHGTPVDGSWAPWKDNEPYISKNVGQDESQRITIEYRNQYEAPWVSSRRDTQPQKYICEI